MRVGLVLLIVAVWAGPAILRGEIGDGLQITTAARSLQPGELIVLTAIVSEPAEAVRVHIFDRNISGFAVNPDTWQALVGIDLDVRPGLYAADVEARAGARITHAITSVVIQPRTFATRELRVDPAFVNPPHELEQRIAQEARQLDALWSRSWPSRLWNGPFLPAVPGSPSGQFGVRSIFNGQPRSRHGGEDFLSPAGTPVVAPNAGRVVLARELYFAGNTVVIDHGLGLFSLLEHLSVIEVNEGDQVRRGQLIGDVGATGRVTGPHLHWAIRVNSARVNPLSLLASAGR